MKIYFAKFRYNNFAKFRKKFANKGEISCREFRIAKFRIHPNWYTQLIRGFFFRKRHGSGGGAAASDESPSKKVRIGEASTYGDPAYSTAQPPPPPPPPPPADLVHKMEQLRSEFTRRMDELERQLPPRS
jgi:hypothetical protein